MDLPIDIVFVIKQVGSQTDMELFYLWYPYLKYVSNNRLRLKKLTLDSWFEPRDELLRFGLIGTT